MGFEYHRTPIKQFFDVFPYRPHNVLSKKTTPSNTITYWHRPHTSKTELPILFVHGIGVGLYPYVPFLGEINSKSNQDGQVGIIAIEIMPISSRLTGTILRKDIMCAEIEKILDSHGWDKVVLVSHSYGSVISTHLFHTPRLNARISSAVLIDPVCFLLHLPDVAYNFVYRKPQHANEHQLYYFASRDVGIAHTLARSFFWTENILWKADLGDRRVTVSLGGRDTITDTDSVAEYLAGDKKETIQRHSSYKASPWSGEALDVLFFKDLDHAQVFDKNVTRALLVGVIRNYCRIDGA
ncbi:hypothetical protein K461DRAFT_282558 [Myriangium duriaei CBS 260.36]|uniref:AB hydrolase-1 domain-containing protein n=1 Tax=Myriangium duriaei CBS 260.36 TaxID=1168546 RepID=A0A9P4IV74_9PEZI|nr:hypothetical protein K461DRAFT_282558 [Myriangium duriaei CBS 260.36]